MHIVGLTGGIGSGKSEASKIFISLGIEVIDLDSIAKDITKKDGFGYAPLVKLMGNDYLNKTKEIDRKKLRKKFFEDISIKKKVESILHPLILEECKNQIKRCDGNNYNYIVIVVPLLFETSVYLDLINESLLIDCRENLQLRRVKARDMNSPTLVQLIMNSQKNRKEKIKKADNVIMNNGTINDLNDQIQRFHRKKQKIIGLNL